MFGSGGAVRVNTVVDGGILRLRATKHALKEQRDRLQSEVQKTHARVMESLRLRNQQTAALHLKRKKSLEALLLKRCAALDSVSQVLLQLDVADTDARLLEAFKLGKTLLQEKTERAGVTVDAVDDAMTDLRDALANQEEIDTLLSGTRGPLCLFGVL